MELFENFVALMLVFLISDVSSLKIHKLDIEAPGPLREGSRACLKCLYDSENGQIEGVQWYKDNRPFFIYTYENSDLSKNPEIVETDINIDMRKTSKADINTLYLQQLKQNHSGHYKCEVFSKQNNDFYKASAGATLDILPPIADPWYKRLWWSVVGKSNPESMQLNSTKPRSS